MKKGKWTGAAQGQSNLQRLGMFKFGKSQSSLYRDGPRARLIGRWGVVALGGIKEGAWYQTRRSLFGTAPATVGSCGEVRKGGSDKASINGVGVAQGMVVAMQQRTRGGMSPRRHSLPGAKQAVENSGIEFDQKQYLRRPRSRHRNYIGVFCTEIGDLPKKKTLGQKHYKKSRKKDFGPCPHKTRFGGIEEGVATALGLSKKHGGRRE